MTSTLEQVSAMSDDQWDDQAIDALLADPELQASWSRFHQVKDALQGENVTIASADFASKISQAIADEPTILAPKSEKKVEQAEKPAKVVRLFKNVGQYAIAATVAAVAVVGIQQVGQESADESPLPVLNTNPVVGVSATPVSLNAPSAQQQTPVMSQYPAHQQLIEQKRRINAYFQDHELQQRVQQPYSLAPEEEQKREEETTTP